MAGESKSPTPNLGGNAFVWVAIAAAILAYATGRSNLENLRPRANELATVPTNTEQDIDARLWQDPFATVLEADGSYYGWTGAAGVRVGSPLHPCRPLGAAQDDMHCRSPLASANNSSAQVIGIIVPGDPYSEDVEFRRRTRYAALAALDVLGYSPRDPQHIGVYIPPAPAGSLPYVAASRSDFGGPLFVPYEFLERDGQPLILLWLGEEAFGQDPLDRLATLLQALGLRPEDGSRVRILGPQGSDTLLAMVQNASRWATTLNDGAPAFPGLVLYDYSATADPAALCRVVQHDGCESQEDWVAWEFNQAHIRFLRATATDAVLARAVGVELARRGIHPGPANVALISEWDTFYGRMLPETFARCLQANSRDGGCDESATDADINRATYSWLRRYSYLRGLDGQTADAAGAAQAARPTASGGSTTAAAAGSTSNLLSETAQGDGQGDYLARLAAELRQTDAQLRNGGGGGIRAVGILGSDLYDKLLVLQAVKAALPHAVFFTTDLDQRLVRPAQGLSTVNLIVASGLGLSLRQRLQQDIPPFRGSYQTAAFLATLMAACAPVPGPGPGNTLADCANSDQAHASGWFKRAMTYEIGRTRPVLLATRADSHPLTGVADRCASNIGQVDVFACTSIVAGDDTPQPASATRRLGLGILAGGAALALSAFLLRLAAGRKYAIARWLAASLVATIVAATRIFSPGLLSRIDIKLLFQGLSLWPSICIQLLSIAFGIAVIFNMRRNSNENLAKLRTRFYMSGVLTALEEERQSRRIKLLEALPFGVRTWQVIHGPGSDTQRAPSDSVAAASAFWVRYVDYARHRVQLARVAALTALGLGAAWAVYLVFPWPSPAAGATTSVIYPATALAAGLTTLAVALYVADITLFSRLLVREAFARDSHAPVWPQSAKEEFAQSSLRTTMTAKDDAQDAFVTTTMTIAYVSERTTCITPFIYYPFIMIALAVIARSPVLGPATFDPWAITVAAIGLLAAFVSAVALRSAAEDARSETVRNLNILKWRALAPESPAELRQRLDLLLERVAALREGAFSPLSQQPVVRALLLPLASYGSTLLLSVLASGY
ncbi:MAG TPA: hypothetical protein VGR92_04180 [Steroidobacteraceae bacterium]|nr:hypothetical protein [Steroidobacteraceae bacterium]